MRVAEPQVVLNLEPAPDNPRNSEGSFVHLADGRTLFAYTKFYGGAMDESAAVIAAVTSSDGGRTWGESRLLQGNEGAENVMSVSLLRLASGEIAFFYLIKNSREDCRLHLRKSKDEGQTWSDKTCCTPPIAYYVVNNDRVVQLSSGRLVVPAAWHPTSEGEESWRGLATCFLSDDDGQTWRQAATMLHAPEASRSGLQEPGVVELKDKRLMMLLRTDQGCQMRSWSADGGETWTEAELTDLASPVSPASVKRLPTTGDLLLVWNDHSRTPPELRGKRTPLTTALSYDEGQTWEHVKVLEPDPDGWYCYTAIAFINDVVLLAYCAGDSNVGGLNRLRITRVPVEWLHE